MVVLFESEGPIVAFARSLPRWQRKGRRISRQSAIANRQFLTMTDRHLSSRSFLFWFLAFRANLCQFSPYNLLLWVNWCESLAGDFKGKRVVAGTLCWKRDDQALVGLFPIELSGMTEQADTLYVGLLLAWDFGQ